MFDRLSYDTEPLAASPRAGDPFYKYEIRNWEFSPRIYKIIGFSAMLHALALLLFFQTSILTMRGCETPFAGQICQVLDTVYVGAILFGTERDYIDAEYEKVDLGDAEVVWLDRTGEAPPLTYPEGYFQIANPEKYALAAPTPELFPGLAPVPNAGNSLFDTPPSLPKPLPDIADDGEPASPFKIEGESENPTVGRRLPRGRRSNGNSRPDNSTPDNSDDIAGNSNSNTNSNPGNPPMIDPTNPVSGVEINKRPVVDLGNYVNELLEKKEVDLQSEFIINAKGKLNKDGRLDPKTFKFLEASGKNEKMVEVVKEAIEALNVAGYLQYLKELSGKDLALVLQQDEVNISAVIQSEMESETRAKTIKSALDLAISISKSRKSVENADQNDKDDLVLLEAAKIETDGKKVVIRFTVPKEIVHPMIQRKLAEQAAELKKPNSAAALRPADNTAIK